MTPREVTIRERPGLPSRLQLWGVRIKPTSPSSFHIDMPLLPVAAISGLPATPPPSEIPATDNRNPLTVYAAGSPHPLRDKPEALDFGTTDPVVVIDQAGTYLIQARLVLLPLNFQSDFTLTFCLRRTNNTATDIGNSSTVLADASYSAGGRATNHASTIALPLVIYETANTTDSLTIFGSCDVDPVGALQVTEASIVAIRIR